MRVLQLLILLVPIASRIDAQSTIHFGFDELPVNTILGEQFAELGVHFAGEGRYAFPSVIAAPPFAQSPAARVAYSYPPGGVLGMWFDYPIASVSMDVAVGSAGEPEGNPGWWLYGLDGYPPSYVVWSSSTDLPGFDTWRRVTLEIPAGRTARALEIQAVNIYQGGNYNPAYYFANIQVGYVPEPSILQLAAIGIVGFIGCWQFKRLRHRYRWCLTAPSHDRPLRRERDTTQSAEPGTPPNGGPATPVGDSGAGEKPPSVS